MTRLRLKVREIPRAGARRLECFLGSSVATGGYGSGFSGKQKPLDLHLLQLEAENGL